MKVQQFLFIVFFLSLFSLSSCSHKLIPLTITRVSTNAVSFNPSKNEKVDISYDISKSAHVWANIYDERNRLVRSIKGTKESSGSHTVSWNGKDERGIFVPDGAYTYTIKAADKKENVVWDLADLTGSETVIPLFFKIDKKTGDITYGLRKPAMVRLNLGVILLKDHAQILLRTFDDWVPRTAGLHEEHWDGWDAGHQINFLHAKNFRGGFFGYSLPDNSIIVTGTNTLTAKAYFRSAWENDQPLRPTLKTTRKFDKHALMDRVDDFSPEIDVSFLPLSGGYKGGREKNNIPVVTPDTPIHIGLNHEDQPYIKGRIEIHILIDEKIVYEDFTGYLPFTYKIPAWVKPGKHTMVVFFCIYNDNYAATVKDIFVRRKS